MELFKLFGTILVNNAEANANIASVEKRAQSAANSIGKSFEAVEKKVEDVGKGITKTGSNLFKSVTAPLAALGGALIALTKTTADYGETVHNASKEVGLSAKAYQELRYALGQAGIAQEQFDLAMSTLNRRIGQARAGNKAMAESLKRMGVDMKALAAGTVDTETVFNASIKTLAEMDDSQMQAALAAELFGDRVAKKLLPLIQSGTDDLEAMRKRAHDLGIIMSDEDAAAAEAFGDNLEDLQAAVGGLFRAIGVKLIPIANQWVEKAIASVAGVQSWVRENKHLVAQLLVFGGGVVTIMTVLSLFAGGLILVGRTITALSVIMGLLTSQPMLIISAIGLLYLAWVSNWGGIQDKTEAVWKVIKPIFAAISDFTAKAVNTVWNWTITGLDWLKDTAASWMQKDQLESKWSWSLLFDGMKPDQIATWFAETFRIPDIPAPSFKAIEEAFANFKWPAMPAFSWPEVEPPDWLITSIDKVAEAYDRVATAIAAIQPPTWIQFEVPQTVVIAIQGAGTALTNLAEAAKAALPPDITEWKTFQDVVGKITSAPLGQFAIKFSSLAKEVMAGDKPIGQAISELLQSNLAIPAGAFAISMLPIPGGWKLALTGVLLALNLLPDVDLSLDNLKQIAGAIYGKVGRFFADLGRRFSKLQPGDVASGIQVAFGILPVIDTTTSTGALKQAGKDVRAAMESFEFPEGTDVAIEEFGETLGTGLATGIASAIAGILRNGPVLVEALASFMTDIEAGLEHMGKEIGLKVVGPFLGGFLEGFISVPVAIAAGIVEKVREGFKKAGMAAGLSEKDADAAAKKAFKLPDINTVDSGPDNVFKGKIPGHASGGYTADVATDQIAGVVHGGEWVMPAWMVRKFPWLARLLEAIRMRGYRLGGLVGYQDGGIVGGEQVATVAATVDVKVEKGKLQKAMESIKGVFTNVLDSLPEGAREQVQKAIDFIMALIKTVEDSLDTLGTVQEGIDVKLQQMKDALDTKAIDMAETWNDTLTSMKQSTADILGSMTMSFIKGTFKWQNVLDAFGSAADQIFTQLFSQIALGLLTNTSEQVKWLTTTLANIGTAIAGFIAQAFAALTAFFWWMGPLAPVAAGAVIAAATVAIGKLGFQLGSMVVGAVSDFGGRNNDQGEASPGRQISEITGPSRDLLVDLLTPLASLDSLVGVGTRIYDLLDLRLPDFGAQLAIAAAGGPSVEIHEFKVYAADSSPQSIINASVPQLEELLAESLAVKRRGQGG